jgi:hypothetical protein
VQLVARIFNKCFSLPILIFVSSFQSAMSINGRRDDGGNLVGRIRCYDPVRTRVRFNTWRIGRTRSDGCSNYWYRGRRRRNTDSIVGCLRFPTNNAEKQANPSNRKAR